MALWSKFRERLRGDTGVIKNRAPRDRGGDRRPDGEDCQPEGRVPGDGDRLPWRASRRPTAEDGQADGRRLPDEVARRPGGRERLPDRGDRVPSGGDRDDGMASGGNCLPGEGERRTIFFGKRVKWRRPSARWKGRGG